MTYKLTSELAAIRLSSYISSVTKLSALSITKQNIHIIYKIKLRSPHEWLLTYTLEVSHIEKIV